MLRSPEPPRSLRMLRGAASKERGADFLANRNRNRLYAVPLVPLSSLAAFAVSSARKRWLGVQNLRLNPAIAEKWRQTYRGTTSVDTVKQRSFVPPMAAYARTYFRKLGISEDIVDLMVSTPAGKKNTHRDRTAETAFGEPKLRTGARASTGTRATSSLLKPLTPTSNYLRSLPDRAIAGYSKAIEIEGCIRNTPLLIRAAATPIGKRAI